MWLVYEWYNDKNVIYDKRWDNDLMNMIVS